MNNYFSDKFIAEQQKKLEEEKREVEEEIKNLTERGSVSNHFKVKYPQFGYKEEENAEEVENYIEKLNLEGHLEDLLNSINHALEKIKKGKYGICEKCGQKISEERLRAYPAATLCIEDQNKEEKNKHLFSQ